MSEKLDRRSFLRKTLLTSTGAALGLSSIEQRALLADANQPPSPLPAPSGKAMPTGKIGKLTVSKLICGGNLISGFAHSRDLIYVSSLMRHYFTDDKIMETFRICEENGINAAVLRTDKDTVRLLKKYWKERGGKLQWLAQTYPKETNLKENVQMAIDNGAVAAFPQGMTGDKFYENGHVDLLGKVIDFIKENGLAAGVGSHTIDTQQAIVESGIKVDFFMKTFNNAGYECENPKQVAEVMNKIKGKTPWVAFKVLGAGVTEPKDGFKYAFDMGADFLNVGMYDFQIKQDAMIIKELLSREICKQ